MNGTRSQAGTPLLTVSRLALVRSCSSKHTSLLLRAKDPVAELYSTQALSQQCSHMFTVQISFVRAMGQRIANSESG